MFRLFLRVECDTKWACCDDKGKCLIALGWSTHNAKFMPDSVPKVPSKGFLTTQYIIFTTQIAFKFSTFYLYVPDKRHRLFRITQTVMSSVCHEICVSEIELVAWIHIVQHFNKFVVWQQYVIRYWWWQMQMAIFFDTTSENDLERLTIWESVFGWFLLSIYQGIRTQLSHVYLEILENFGDWSPFICTCREISLYLKLLIFYNNIRRTTMRRTTFRLCCS